jgi:6-pyruvoyltetrahydropterin 2'-reductase
MTNKITYSEIFQSLQGEGAYTGRNTAWLRFFLCNLQCDGFGQIDPTDPSTYILPYKDFDVSTITRVEDLPVFDYGCDSSYTWAKKFKHLMHTETSAEICDNIRATLKSPSNPNGLFIHPDTNQDIHMAFTGGEPMLNQQAMVDIISHFVKQKNYPKYVTVETNGTKPFDNKAELDSFILNHYDVGDGEWFWSVSPKLWSTAGEKPEKAICPDVVAEYVHHHRNGQLKYVVNGTEQSWDEVAQHTEAYRDANVPWDVYIMPVGATKEQQEVPQIAAIADEALKRGYNVSGRLHCYIYGNQIGT